MAAWTNTLFMCHRLLAPRPMVQAMTPIMPLSILTLTKKFLRTRALSCRGRLCLVVRVLVARLVTAPVARRRKRRLSTRNWQMDRSLIGLGRGSLVWRRPLPLLRRLRPPLVNLIMKPWSLRLTTVTPCRYKGKPNENRMHLWRLPRVGARGRDGDVS